MEAVTDNLAAQIRHLPCSLAAVSFAAGSSAGAHADAITLRQGWLYRGAYRTASSCFSLPRAFICPPR